MTEGDRRHLDVARRVRHRARPRPGARPGPRGRAAAHVGGRRATTRSTWRSSGTPTEASGAVVMGRRLFDIVDGPLGWNDEMGYGAGLAATPPFFVVTHSAPDDVRLNLDFTFVTDGLRGGDRPGPGRGRGEGRGRDGRGRRRAPVRRPGPRRRAAPAPRTDRPRWRHAALRRERTAPARAAIRPGVARRRPT